MDTTNQGKEMTRTHLIILGVVLVLALVAHFVFHAAPFTIAGFIFIAAIAYFIYHGILKRQQTKP